MTRPSNLIITAILTIIIIIIVEIIGKSQTHQQCAAALCLPPLPCEGWPSLEQQCVAFEAGRGGAG